MCKNLCPVISKTLEDSLHKNKVILHLEGSDSPITGTLQSYDKGTGKVVVLLISPSDGWPAHPEKRRMWTVCAAKIMAVSTPVSR